jgi:putative heme-binding domain-containing protein
MDGFEKAFAGRSVAGLPDGLIAAMGRHGVGSVAVGLRRGDSDSLSEALKIIASPEAPADQRRQFIQVLGEIKSDDGVPVLIGLAKREKNEEVLAAVFVALQPFASDEISAVTLQRLGELRPNARAAALTLLTSRASFAGDLLEAVVDGKVPAQIVAPEFVRKLKRLVNEPSLAMVDRLWPKAGRPTSDEMDREIARLTRALDEAHGDPYAGKRLFNATCATCHRLFNQGGDIGPDLTSLDRQDAGSLLLAIVNPSAEIREGYQNYGIETKDERALGGFIVEQDRRKVILRGFDGQNVVLQRDEIAALQAVGMSLMPEGLTSALDDQQARDLFAYLRSSQPLSD